MILQLKLYPALSLLAIGVTPRDDLKNSYKYEIHICMRHM